jgi:GTP-binding protein Era
MNQPIPEAHPPEFRCGFIAIIGSPNAGKSTLLNRLVGQKIAITSKKPQTTRNRITGILHCPGAQLIFVDTPGIHRASKQLNVRIVETALATLESVDVIVFVVDASRKDEASESLIRKALDRIDRSVVLVLNKVDLVPKAALLSVIDHWAKTRSFEAIVPISAKTGDQVPQLAQVIEGLLPFGPPLFPEDSVTDLPMRFLAAEIVREKVFRYTGQEIPYSTMVTVDDYKEEKRMTHIHATIHVERDSQKRIVIGQGGSMLKRIGEAARIEIEEMIEARVFLHLFVRVDANWSRDAKKLERMLSGVE